MMKIWLFLVSDLKHIPVAQRKRALEQASKSNLLPNEMIAMAAWLVIVYFFTQSILTGATDENRLTFTLVANLIVTIPLLLAVFVPLHIRRIRRDIKRQIK
ncbi:MAG: hypothetical protein WC073_16795 [Sterolibacterium sp.]